MKIRYKIKSGVTETEQLCKLTTFNDRGHEFTSTFTVNVKSSEGSFLRGIIHHFFKMFGDGNTYKYPIFEIEDTPWTQWSEEREGFFKVVEEDFVKEEVLSPFGPPGSAEMSVHYGLKGLFENGNSSIFRTLRYTGAVSGDFVCSIERDHFLRIGFYSVALFASLKNLTEQEQVESIINVAQPAMISFMKEIGLVAHHTSETVEEITYFN